jgi:hypothetical protein
VLQPDQGNSNGTTVTCLLLRNINQHVKVEELSNRFFIPTELFEQQLPEYHIILEIFINDCFFTDSEWTNNSL